MEKDGHHKDGIDRLYHEGFRKDETENIENGIGVYIIASQNSLGEFVPEYVGRTYNGFGIRLQQHFDKRKFAGLLDQSSISIFLIARADDGRIVTRDEATEKDLVLIQQLEQELIIHCARLNTHLVNVQNRTKRDIYVAGFRGDNREKREPAAEALGKLLHT